MSTRAGKRSVEESVVDKETSEMTPLYRLAHLITTTAPKRLVTFVLGACLLAWAILPTGAAAIPSNHPFEIIPGSFQINPSTNQAGAHEDLVTHFDFAHNPEGQTYNDVRTTVVNLPPGFLGNNTAMPTCTDAELIGGLGNTNSVLEPECPHDTQVGQISFDFTFFSEPQKWTFPVYNMETDTGVTATLGFKAEILTQILPISFRPQDSGLTITSPSIDDLGEIHNVTVTIWGVPAAASHNPQRGEECGLLGGGECVNGGEQVNIPIKPFLSTPTSCSQTPLKTTMKSDSWEEEENWSEESTEIAPMEGCERDPFYPSLEVQPTTRAAETPTGLNTSLIIPQTYEDPDTLATSHLKKAVVTLPEGFALNPSSGAGLGSCTEAQYESETAFSRPGEGCPSESKVGTVEVETPVLTEKALGSVYIAKPFENPYDNLARPLHGRQDPRTSAIIVKTAGKVEANPVSGQLTTTFDNLPQLPFNKFDLELPPGRHLAPLQPRRLRHLHRRSQPLAPTPNPNSPRHVIDSFEMTEGVHDGPCPSGGHPALPPPADRRLDQQRRLGTTPPSTSASPAKTANRRSPTSRSNCRPAWSANSPASRSAPKPQIAQAKSREHEGGGAEEEAEPLLPGELPKSATPIVEAGVGSVLAQAPGKIYLAGPYHGSAISVVSITDAKVGPFDLGTVVVREALQDQPRNRRSLRRLHRLGPDPPHRRRHPHPPARHPHLHGPPRIRPQSDQLRTDLDRLDPARLRRQLHQRNRHRPGHRHHALSRPPAATGSPSAPTSPSASAARPSAAGDPAFKATLTTHPGEANTGRAQVTLPRSEFLEQAHIGTVCTRVQFAEGAVPGEKCPANSVYGYAKAITPILSEPLEGPVYLRSNGGERKLPDLVAALHAGEINIDLVGYVEGVHGGIRNTFQNVPDAPVSSFTLEMEGGAKGLLVNSTNLCAAKHRATAFFDGHNGKIKDFKPLLAPASCPQEAQEASKAPGQAPPSPRREELSSREPASSSADRSRAPLAATLAGVPSVCACHSARPL